VLGLSKLYESSSPFLSVFLLSVCGRQMLSRYKDGTGAEIEAETHDGTKT
jgi:hypothetical protein